MAASPRFKVYDAKGRYQAACKEPEAAAVLVGLLYGEGSTIRCGHSAKQTVYTQGVDGDAAESYDACVEVVLRNESPLHRMIRES